MSGLSHYAARTSCIFCNYLYRLLWATTVINDPIKATMLTTVITRKMNFELVHEVRDKLGKSLSSDIPELRVFDQIATRFNNTCFLKLVKAPIINSFSIENRCWFYHRSNIQRVGFYIFAIKRQGLNSLHYLFPRYTNAFFSPSACTDRLTRMSFAFVTVYREPVKLAPDVDVYGN